MECPPGNPPSAERLVPPGDATFPGDDTDERAKAMAASKDFKKGDRVEWDTSQGRTEGHVLREQTSETHIKGHKVAASKEHPQYIVESDKSGKRAAHKPEELRKRS
jgi:hypothetical protein